MASKTTVLITGCSPGGIGHALAVEFHKRGCHVIATARRPSVLRQLGDMGMSTLQLDVTDQASVDACKEETARLTGGRLDILVNNAGQIWQQSALDLDMDEVKALFDVNLYSIMRMCKAFASLLIPARGLIINESSVGCIITFPCYSTYTCSKAAIVAYSDCLRFELRPFGVRVMTAIIGFVETNFRSKAEGTLPPDLVYQPAASAHSAARKMADHMSFVKAEVFAARLVAAALKGEGWLGGRIGGSPDWLWEGSWAWSAWFLSSLPRCCVEPFTAFLTQTSRMTKLIQEVAAALKPKTT